MDEEGHRSGTPLAGDADSETPGDTSPTPPETTPALESNLRRIEDQFALVTGKPAIVAEACAELRAQLSEPHLAAAAPRAALRLARLLQSANDERAYILFTLLDPILLDASDQDAAELAAVLFQAREPELRRQTATVVLARWLLDQAAMPHHLVDRLAATLLELLPRDPVVGDDASLLDQAAEVLRRAIAPEAAGDLLEAWLTRGGAESARRLAARLLDRDGQPVPVDRLERLLGPEAAQRLGDLLQYTRADHRDLAELMADGRLSATVLEDLDAALRQLGRTALGAVIGELGWRAVSCGIAVEHRVGLSVDGGFPFVVAPAEATLLERCGSTRRVWDQHLVVAHGGRATSAARPSAEAPAIQRFRRYNVLHAELLNEILEVAPVTPAKVARILGSLDEVVEHFVALFADHTEEAHRLPEVYAGLRESVAAGLAGVPDDRPLDAELTRLVQMFEDPRSLDEVRTLHGLKRYLHQQGLRLAFRRFRSGRATNRTVDLAVVAGDRVVRTLRRIRYIDFEPDPRARGIPFFPALIVEALGRRLLHGTADGPDLEILIYGNEIQTYVEFRNHPAFLRIDLSPPQRGGMIDLEYFGVSQYEIDHHPDISLPWIQRIVRRLDFDARAEGLRLHIRYDKERAFDLDDLIRGVRLMCCLLPHLMNLDWVLGGLRYPEPAKAAVADRWADWIVQWGVLPLDQLLTADRRAILQAVREESVGAVEIPWDGRGEVRDRFAGLPGPEFGERLRDELAAADPAGDWAGALPGVAAQIPLQRLILDPLRERAEGEAGVADTDLPLHFAALLVDAGAPLERAARLAAVATSVERHLRFTTVGSVQGYPVQCASLLLPGERLDIAVLRDANGISRLAEVHERPFYFTPGPWSRDDGPDCSGRDIGPADLAARLRRDNYVAAGYDVGAAGVQSDLGDLPRLFTLANPLAAPAPRPDDRTLSGIIAAGGKAAGVAVFYRPDLTADDVDGAVLFAPALRPEDSPLLRRAAAVVSTGGGILSHAGLIAQELGKPALVVEGSWRLADARRPALACHTIDYTEEEKTVGPYRVALRKNRHEREEALQEGDLVVVDADLGCLGVLGQDRDALALQEELRHLDLATSELDRVPCGPDRLVLRGRQLRTTHQLRKLLARLDQPQLARHAARELLHGHRRLEATAGSATAAAPGPAGMLRCLFENPRCGTLAREAAVHEEALLAQRLLALRAESSNAVAAAETAHEVLVLRRGVRRLNRSLRTVRRALADVGVSGFEPADLDISDLDQGARRRLEWLRARYGRELERHAAEPDAWWRMRSGRRALVALDAILGAAPDGQGDLTLRERARTAAVAGKQRALARLGSRTIVTAADGGLELAPLIGAKGAGLGEIARILDPACVPDWFAVSDAAFRRTLAAGIGPAKGLLGLVTGTPLLLAVNRILDHPDLEPRAQAAAIRELWRSVEIPADIADEVRRTYHALGNGDAANTEPGREFVAIRSSSFEEDTSHCSWAGQFDTFLCVRGDEAVLEHLKLAWASLWSERVLVYRRALAARDAGAPEGIRDDLRLDREPGGGVIIQRLVDSRAAGVLHSLSAASGQPREIVINAGLGFGEGVVSGTVEVDQIVVSRATDLDRDPLRFRYTVGDKRTRVVFDRRQGLGTRIEETLYHQRLRPALEYTDLDDLVRAAARLESAYGYPLDIEFAFEEHRLYVLQARPIVAFQEALREAVENPPWQHR